MAEILLESGTNELEILEFEIGDVVYGVNVAKVVEILSPKPVCPVPNSPDIVEGVFMSRGEVISVVDLFKILNVERKQDEGAGKRNNMFITCCFNQTTTAFHVGKVRSIKRISWTDIKEPPKMANVSKSQDTTGMLTGIVEFENELVLILDFEHIVARINKDMSLDNTGVEKFATNNNVCESHIVVADDSAFLNKMIVDSLGKAGFNNIMSFKNGAEAWDYVRANKDKPIACVVSDIEMPQMDGLALTKRIKDDVELKKIPVLLFSSLINEQMVHKCKSVGADGQFSKPQINTLIEELIQLLSRHQK